MKQPIISVFIEGQGDVRFLATQKGKAIKAKGWELIHESTGNPVREGEIIPDFRGDTLTVSGGKPPHKQGSTGRIYTDQGQFFPGVCNLKWRIVKP